jgi:hypothetical protein
MSRSAYTLAAIALCVISQVGCARRAELQRPPRVSVGPLPTSDVEAAIYEGCSKKKWIPSKISDGRIEATLYLRTHVAVVDIDYDADSFQVHYVRSENLNYKNRNGEELIHPNYNAWVKNPIADIDAALASDAHQPRCEARDEREGSGVARLRLIRERRCCRAIQKTHGSDSPLLSRQPDRAIVHLIVVLAVVEVGLEATTDAHFVLGRNGQVAAIEQRVHV